MIATDIFLNLKKEHKIKTNSKMAGVTKQRCVNLEKKYNNQVVLARQGLVFIYF